MKSFLFVFVLFINQLYASSCSDVFKYVLQDDSNRTVANEIIFPNVDNAEDKSTAWNITSLILSPNTYRDIVIGSSHELHLRDGDYYFRNLTVNNFAKIIVDSGTARIFVRDDVNFISSSLINSPSKGNFGDVSKLVLYSNQKITAGYEVTMTGYIYAKDIFDDVGNKIYLNGSLSAKEITLSSISIIEENLSGVGVIDFGPFCGASTNPIADYRFDECEISHLSGGVKDSSGFGHDGTAIRDLTIEEGKINNGYGFNGSSTDDYISIDSSTLNGKSNYSFSMWVNPIELNSADTFVSAERRNNDDDELLFRIANNSIELREKRVILTFNSLSISDFTIDAWNYLVLTRDDNEVCVYINNKKQCKAHNFSGTLDILDGAFMIGQDSAGVDRFYQGGDFHGSFDEFKVYDKALSETNIDEIRTNESIGKNFDGTNRDSIFCSDNSCANHQLQLNFSIYNLISYNGGQIDSNNEFEQVITIYANDTYKFGSGLLSQINTQGSNNNPFGSSDRYLSVMKGYIYIANSGFYEFSVNGDDAVEVLIDDVVVSHWYGGHGRSSSPTTDSRITRLSVNLMAGYHKLEFRHHEYYGGDNYELHWKKPNSAYEIVPVNVLFHCIPSSPMLDYRFDECDINSTVGEVKDSSGYGYDGTLFRDVTMVEGKINNAYHFNGASTDDYVSINKNGLDGAINYSFSMWVKPIRLNSKDTFVSAERDNRDRDELLFRINGSNVAFKHKGSQVTFYNLTTNDFSMGNWNYLALTKSDNEVCVYLNSKKECKPHNFSGALDILDGAFMLGQDSAGVDRFYQRGNFDGSFDEFKIFNKSLSQIDIENIRDNESIGKNFDGINRQKPICVPISQCFNDNFNRTDLENRWSIIKQKNYTPQISSNKLMLTNNGGSIATGVTLAGKFPSSNNYVEIEFEHNAYGGSGADGMTITLSDANTTPIAGAYGGSLGYANRTGINGFAGGWLGFGFDEYGNFSNPTEGRHGGVGFRKDSIAVRGEGSGQLGYEYLTGTSTLIPEVDNTPAGGYLYKISIDTRDSKTMIKIDRDIKNGNGFSTIIDWFDATQSAVAPLNFKFSLTASSGGATNFHSIDDLVIKARYCGTLGNPDTVLSTFFDSWDIFKNINQRTISTKKVSQNFDLSIVALNEANDALQDYNGSVCARIVDSSDTSLTSWEKLQFANDDKLNATFSVTKADKNAKVQIVWKDEVTENCPLSNETNSTKSTDSFAIRPDSFSLTLPSIGYAGENFGVDFSAGSVVDYNETLNSSFMVEANISKPSCFNGALHVTSFSFENGLKNSVDVNYSDVGDINVTIKEMLGSEFAVIDKNDTTDSDRLISPFTASMTIKPYELNVTDVVYDEGWLYMADVNDISQKVKFSVLANDIQHNLVRNFTDDCYAQDVDVKTHFSVQNVNSNVKIKYNDATVDNLSDINRTITIPKASFVNSKADIEYSFNIERDHKVPYEPIKIGLREVSIESFNVAKDENNATVNLDRDFYYGRVKTEDLSTNKQNTPHSLHVEVYKLGKNKQSSLNWYVNEDDINTTMTFAAKDGFSFATDKNGVNIANISTMSLGVINFDMTNSWNTSDSAMIHLDVPLWLWYSKYNGYNSANDCSYHPCFEYRYIKADSSTGIRSGDFKGSSIGNDYNATKQKIGVKTFR